MKTLMARKHSLRRDFRGRLTVVLLVVLLPPAATLIWLGLRLLEVDRSLQAQREIEGREAAAAGISASLAQSLAELDNRIATGETPEGVLRITATVTRVSGEPPGRILWNPNPPSLQEAATMPFIESEKAEVRGHPEEALRDYTELARAASRSVRVGALVRMARVQRGQRRIDDALNTYKALAKVHDIAFNGAPVDLIARREICRLLKDSHRLEVLRANVEVLVSDFLANRWTLDRVNWELNADDIEQLAERPLGISAERKALSATAEWIWRNSGSALSESGPRGVVMDGIPVTILPSSETPQNEPRQFQAIAVGPSVVQGWLEHASQSASVKAGRFSLLTESGELFMGGAPDSGDAGRGGVRRNPSDTGLPWTVVLSPTEASRAAASFDGRRRLLVLGLIAIVLLLAGGGYVLWRVTERELAVARLQTDFVATVSHEFRTPLTSLRHITELLQEDDEFPADPSGAGRERRKTFYAALERSTERLHRLVESLLDFSRMETGRKPWRLESVDAGVLTAGVVSEFQSEVEARGFRIDLIADRPGIHLLQADADALGHALWNLLDNAVKYSPDHKSISVSVGRDANGIVISVKDLGLGIPLHEQRQIFDKFVRGGRVNELGIKGTGLGLAIVSHIVEAHGGAVELESEEGKGSTFKMVLPAET